MIPGTTDWVDKVPPFETQYSSTTHTDAQDCVEESCCHLAYMLKSLRYSPRALGYDVVVTPNGSNISQAILAANTKGLKLYQFWPTPDSFTWESYYAPIPPDIDGAGDTYNITLVEPNLDISPIWTELVFPDGAHHMVAQINQTQYFDSELGNPIKPLDYEGAVIVYQTSVIFTPIKVQNWYPTKANFSDEQFAGFSEADQAAINANPDEKNGILDGTVYPFIS